MRVDCHAFAQCQREIARHLELILRSRSRRCLRDDHLITGSEHCVGEVRRLDARVGQRHLPMQVDAPPIQVHIDIRRCIDPRFGNTEYTQILADQMQITVGQSMLPAQVAL